MADRRLYFPRLRRRTRYTKFNNYKKYKWEIREDCQGRCVYCDIHENELGGVEFMTLDHFRPQALFTHLTNNPKNLLWCCTLCNKLKRDYWPADGTEKTYVLKGGFVDPFTEDLLEYFDVSPQGKLIPLKHPATYMINTLKLNRDGAVRTRKKRRLEFEERAQTLQVFRQAIREMDDALDHPDLPEALRAKFLIQKDEFARQYDAVSAETKPDFSLR